MDTAHLCGNVYSIHKSDVESEWLVCTEERMHEWRPEVSRRYDKTGLEFSPLSGILRVNGTSSLWRLLPRSPFARGRSRRLYAMRARRPITRSLAAARLPGSPVGG
jgi:hypothetical protein